MIVEYSAETGDGVRIQAQSEMTGKSFIRELSLLYETRYTNAGFEALDVRIIDGQVSFDETSENGAHQVLELLSYLPTIIDTVLQHEDLQAFREPLIDFYKRRVN